MLDTLGRYWRVVGTGISFLAFGVGGLVLQVVVLPPLYLLVWNAPRRQRWAREVEKINQQINATVATSDGFET